MATRRRFSSPPPIEASATHFGINAGTSSRLSNGNAHIYGGSPQLRHFRSISALTQEEHRKQTNGSPFIREQRSVIALRPEGHLEEQRRQLQLVQRQRSGSYPIQEEAQDASNVALQLAASRQPEPEKSKFFVRSNGFTSSRLLAKGPILSNAVVAAQSGKLYEFVFPTCYKPVFLRPSFWQKYFKAPEYHIVLLDPERYMPEPFVILREAHQFAPTGRAWRSTETDEQAVHIASCHRDQVIGIVQEELQRRSKYCAEEFRRAVKIKKGHTGANRDVTKRDLVRCDHKLMQIAADCAGDKGARGAKWLFDRLIRYLEFIGAKEGDDVVVRAAKFLVDDIHCTARQIDISLSRKTNEAANGA